jgi:nucleotide-binding universal stress UspA family protein
MIRTLPSLLAETSPWLRLLEWLGYDFSDVPPGAVPEFQWTNFPASAGVFVLIAVVAAVLYGVWRLYRGEIDSCPPSIKFLLTCLRGLVVLLLTLVFLGPAIVLVRQRTVKPTIVIARDASQSMATADEYRDDLAAQSAARALNTSVAELRKTHPTRVQLIERALDPTQSPLLQRVSQRGSIQVLDFADKVNRLDFRNAFSPPASSEAPEEKPSSGNSEGTKPSSATAPLAPLPPLVAAGSGTDLWTLIREGIALDNPAALIIFTEGQHTAKDNAQAAAQEAAAKGVPLYFVGVGDPSKPRNLKVTNVYARPQVWQDEPFEIEAMVLAQGIDANEVRVELIEQRLGEGDSAVGPGVTVASQTLRLPEGGGVVPAPFSHAAKEEGRFVYSVRVESVDGERDEADNIGSSAVIKALSREKVRVLLVAGSPTWEFRLVQKLLARDKTMVVSCWLQTLDEERAQEGTRPISRLPVTRDELFWYDVVLLFDPNPQEFDQPWIELLKQFLGEHAGGLLFMAGPKHSGRLLTGPRTSEFQKLMPVSFGDVGALEVASLAHEQSTSLER